MRNRISDKLTYRCNTCGMVFEKEVKNVVDSLPYCSQKCWGKAKKLKQFAPEMLNMLKRMTQDHQCSQRSDGPHADCDCWFCAARNLINRAEAP